MNETISKAVLSGLGFASLAGEAIRETARGLVKKSKISEEEGRRVVEAFHARLARAERTLEKRVNMAVRKALKQLELASPRNPKATKDKATPKTKSQRRTKPTRTTRAR